MSETRKLNGSEITATIEWASTQAERWRNSARKHPEFKDDYLAQAAMVEQEGERAKRGEITIPT